MTRTKNQPARDAIETLRRHILGGDRRADATPPLEEQDLAEHVREAFRELDRWAHPDDGDPADPDAGRPNDETQAVLDHLADDEEAGRFWRGAARAALRAAGGRLADQPPAEAARDAAAGHLAERLHDAFARELVGGVLDLTADLVGAGLQRVDWRAVAAGYLDALADDPADAPAPRTNPPEPSVVLLDLTNARFPLGRLACTPGVQAEVPVAEVVTALERHASGDWGEVCDDDRAENEVALRDGFRLLSAYRSESGVKFWVITEADRSGTTVLTPDEY